MSNAERLNVERDAATRFAFAAEQISERIEERLDAYALLLRGGAGMFSGSEEVTREDWRYYVDNLHLGINLAGSKGVGLILLIAPTDLDAHVNAIRASGVDDYNVTPQGPRDIYSSVVYLEPYAGVNLQALGVDMLSDPVRQQAMHRARDMDRASLSRLVSLDSELGDGVQAGTLLFVPVYQRDMPIVSAGQRRDALIGWVYSPFRMDDLMAGVIGDWTQIDMSAVNIHIYDSPQKSSATLLFASDGASTPTDTQRLLSRILPMHGQQWLLEFEQSGSQGNDYASAWRTLMTGSLLSLLLFSLLRSMARTRNRALAIAKDLTRDIQQQEMDLRVAHHETEQFREALDYVSSCIFIKDSNRCYVYANKATLELLNCSAENLLGSSDEQHFPPETCAQLAEIDSRVLAGHKNRAEVVIQGSDGTRKTYLSVQTPVYDGIDQGNITGVLGISTDITNIKDQEDQLRQIAHLDALTLLPNRLLLADRLQQAIAHTKRGGGKLGVVYLDLDGFKAVNDQHGHDVGDELLRVLAARLKDTLRDGDTVARIGGDEFVALLLDLDDLGHVQTIVQRMLHAAADTVHVRGLELKVSASIGVALYPQETSEEQPCTDQLLRLADQAMYQAKSAGKNRVYLYAENGRMMALLTQTL